MEYIKNKTDLKLDLVVIGITLESGEKRELSEFASRSKLQECASYFNDLVYTDKIILVNSDGSEFSKVESVQYFSNAYSRVSIDYNTSKSFNNYYFLKDTLKIKKNDYVEKFFRGRLKSLYIISSKYNIDVMITTGDGVELPADNLLKRQSLEFGFDGDLADIKLKISAEGSTDVDIFIEGWNNEFSPQELQDFIDSWYHDEGKWKTTNSVIVSFTNNSFNILDPVIKKGTNTLLINDKKDKNDDDFYRIYKVTDNEYFVELLESNKWSTWSPNRYYVRAKNITHIEFSDGTVDLSTAELNSYIEHNSDKD